MPANLDPVVKESGVLVTTAKPVRLGSLSPVHRILTYECIMAVVEGFKPGPSPSIVHRYHLVLNNRDFRLDIFLLLLQVT